MADLSDALGSGTDALRNDLVQHYQPDDGQPFSDNPEVLTDRLARKLTPIGRVDFKPTDFSKKSDDDKPDDLAKFGTKVGPDDDLAKFGTPISDLPEFDGSPAPPSGAFQPPPPTPVLQSVHNALSLPGRAVVHGAIEGTGGVVQGLGTMGAATQSIPGVQAVSDMDSVSNQFGGVINDPEALKKQQALEAKIDQDAKSVDNNAFVKAGKSIKGAADTIAPVSDAEKNTITGKLGIGIGNIAPYAAATLIDPVLGVAAGAVGMGAQGYGDTYEAAKKAGASDENATKAAGWSATTSGILGALPLPAAKIVTGALAKMAVSGMTFASVGELQEALEQQIAKEYYDPKAGYSADVKRILANLILGAGMGGLHALNDRQPEPAAVNGTGTGTPPPAGEIPPEPGIGGGRTWTGQTYHDQPSDTHWRENSEGMWFRYPGPDNGTGTGSAGPEPGPPPGSGPDAGSNPGASSEHAQSTPPPEPPPERGEGMGPDYRMDAATRRKMERIMRHFDPSVDVSKMADHELYNAVNEHLRDTSSTGYSAKPETPEETAQREQAATERTEREGLKRAGWTDAHINAMSPQQRRQYFQDAMARGSGAQRPPEPEAQPTSENTTKPTESATTSSPDKVVSETETGRRDAPINAQTVDDVLKASEIPAEPTPAQAKAGNYQHGHLEIPHLGLEGANGISIETGVGQMRRGTGPDGKPWEVRMPVAYGRIKGTVGADGDHLDVFVGPNPKSPHVFLIDQRDPDSDTFDEHKIMVGFDHPANAVVAYRDSFADSPKGQAHSPRMGAITALTADEFKDWLKNGDHTKGYSEAAQAANPIKQAVPATEPTAEHHAQIENVLGKDADRVMAADIARAAELLSIHPDLTPSLAFQHAVIEGAYTQHLLNRKQLVDAYGTKAEEILGTGREGAPGRSARADASRPEPRPQRPGGGAEGGVVQGRGEARAPEQAEGGRSKEHHEPNAGGAEGRDTGSPDRHPGRQSVPAARKPQTQKAGSDPLNLLQFIASKGGLKDHPEFRALDAHLHVVDMPSFPPRRRLVQPKGILLDHAREIAQEAGYFPKEQGDRVSVNTINDLLNAIEDGLRKKHLYPEGEEPAKAREKAEAESSDHAEQAAIAHQIRDIEADPDYWAMPDDLKALAAEIMVKEGLSIDDAMERAAVRLVSDDNTEYPVTKDTIGRTFGKGAKHAVQPKPASENGKRAPQERVERARPKEEKEDHGDGERVPDTGAPSGEAEEPRKPVNAKAERDAPTWAEILHQLPMSPDGRTRQFEIAFDIIKTMTGKTKPKYKDLTPAQKTDLLEQLKVRAAKPAGLAEPESSFPPPTSDAFKRWFGDSKVVDGDGKPLIVYHGSNKQFSEFKPRPSFRQDGYGHKYEISPPAFFFTGDKDTARIFAKDKVQIDRHLRGQSGGRAQTRAFFLSVKNPLDFVITPQVHEAIRKEGRYFVRYDEPNPYATEIVGDITGYQPQTWREVQQALDDPDVVTRLKAEGFDGAKLAEENGTESWAVFDPTQIKSATGNSGTFDPSNPSILASPADMFDKGADGKDQGVLPGAERESQGTQAQRKANAPLKPKVAQKPLDVGLFGDEKDQGSLFEGGPSFGRGAEGQQYTRDRGRETGNEHLIAYDKNGEEVDRSAGTSKTVTFSPKFKTLILDPNEDIVAHHNHPSSSSLSQEDVSALAAPGLRAVWAHGHNGTIFRAELTPEAKAALPKAPNDRYRALAGLRRMVIDALFGPMQTVILANRVSMDEANEAINHLANEVLHHAGIIDYRTNFELGDFISRVDGLAKAINDVISRASRRAFNGRQAANDGADRRAKPLRHPGDLGATFDRASLAAPVRGARRVDQERPANDRPQATPRLPVDKGVGGFQPRLLESEAPFEGEGEAIPPPEPETSPEIRNAEGDEDEIARLERETPPSDRAVTLGAIGNPAEAIKAFKNFWASTYQPELFSDRALMADPLFARYKSAQAHEKDAILRASEHEWNYWNKKNDNQRIGFLSALERGLPIRDPREAAMARRYRAMLDANWAEEVRWGSKASFVDDYFPHIWERPDDWRAFSEARAAQMGPTWFQKKRTIDYIDEGLNAGLKLKYTNPVDILVHRLSSGVDMRQRMQLLYALKDQGLAWEGAQGGDMLVKRGWRLINAPDRKNWVIHPDAQLLWKNAVEAKGLWQAEHVGGSMFRGWMALKAAWIPMKLAFSAFHPLHVLHINYSNGMAQAWDDLTRGRDVTAALKALANGIAGPMVAAPGASAGAAVGAGLGMLAGAPVWGGIAGSIAGAAAYGAAKRLGAPAVPHPGKVAREAWATRPSRQTPAQRAAVALMNDGGFVPQISEDMQTHAKKQLAVAFQRILRKEAGPRDWRRAITAALRRPTEILQGPIFEQWIPNLKAAAYMQAASALLKRRPDLLTYHNDRRVALRAIARSIDNRFGEMFYGNLFWNRYLKDGAIGSFLSLGWNLGFVREFGGAAMETVTRPAGLLPPLKPSAGRKEIRAATNKIPFVLAYVATAALINGIMSMLFDDDHAHPEGLDFIFPRIGGKNPDGSARRVTNMFYTREVPMLLKHIQERGGNWITGTGEMIYNKMLLEPFHELMNNRDYYGYNIWDENAPVYQQMWQAMKHTFTNETSPMAVSGAKYAAELSGHPFPSMAEALANPDKLTAALAAKGVDMSMLGFGPAPAYVEKSAIQNRISYLYQAHVAPASKPAADEENSHEKMSVRTAIMIARRDKDASLLELARERGKAIGLSPKSMAEIGKTPTDVYLFSRLPNDDQLSLLHRASPEEKERYFHHAHQQVRRQINRERYAPQETQPAEARL